MWKFQYLINFFLLSISEEPSGLLAQVVPSHASDFHLLGSSPSINTYPAKKKKKKKKEKENERLSKKNQEESNN